MKEELRPPRVENIAMAVVPVEEENGEQSWKVYFLNLRAEQLEGLLVRSSGYGEKEGEQIKTSELRHLIEEVPAHAAVPVETIVEDVFNLNNQYWVSFWADGTLYDRKFVFLSQVIDEKNFSKVPILDKQGVVII